MHARHEISVMEGILENAVQYGAQVLNRRLQASAAAPDMVLLSGASRARGFRLDGYGVFFDVEFPAIRRSVVWSFRMLDRPDPALRSAFQDLRRNVQSLSDPRARQDLERALNLFEGQMRPFIGAGQAAAPGAITAASTDAGRPPAASAPGPTATMEDPRAIYLGEVKNALVDAMLDHGGPIGVGQDEWLTVAARESDGRVVPGDPGDAATTVILRIKGSDLAGVREGRLPREEARKRIEAREF